MRFPAVAANRFPDQIDERLLSLKFGNPERAMSLKLFPAATLTFSFLF